VGEALAERATLPDDASDAQPSILAFISILEKLRSWFLRQAACLCHLIMMIRFDRFRLSSSSQVSLTPTRCATDARLTYSGTDAVLQVFHELAHPRFHILEVGMRPSEISLSIDTAFARTTVEETSIADMLVAESILLRKTKIRC